MPTGNVVDRSADALRCDFFLHVLRDDLGTLHDQHRDDELIVGRFEQCLSADVLANTFPNKRLPSTGGPSLLLIPWLVALLAAVIRVLMVSVGGAYKKEAPRGERAEPRPASGEAQTARERPFMEEEPKRRGSGQGCSVGNSLQREGGF